MKVIIGHYQKQKLFKILLYIDYIFDQQNIKHRKIIHQFLDKKNRIYISNNIEHYEKAVYIIDPFEKDSYNFIYDEENITINFQILQNSKLYPYIEKDVYEKVFKIEFNCDNLKIIEKLIKDAFLYSQRYLDSEMNDKKIYIYQYNESHEVWEKYTEISKRSINTIYLPAKQSEDVLLDVEKFLMQETKLNYEKFGIPYHKTYCFYGPPGSGKTSLIHAICSTIQKHICIYRFSSKTKDSDVANALKWIPKNSVFVIEDIDCIIKNREDLKGNISFSGLLNILDGISINDCMLTFITTNYFLQLDQAIKRPGRIDYILEFTYINKDQIYKMLNLFYPDEKEDFDIIYNELKNIK